MKSSMLAFLVFMVISCGEQKEPLPSISFISELPKNIDHNRPFQFSIRAIHSENQELTYSVNAPQWISFDEERLTISGTPDWNILNSSFSLTIVATDGLVEEILKARINITFRRNHLQFRFWGSGKFSLSYAL